jgi:hypothetical protein
VESIEEQLRSAYIKGILDSIRMMEESGDTWIETTQKFHAPNHGPIIKSLAVRIREHLLTKAPDLM